MADTAPVIAVSTPADDWTDQYVDRLVPGDIIHISEKCQLKDRTKFSVSDPRIPAVKLHPNSNRVVYGWRKIRGEVFDIVPVLSPTKGEGPAREEVHRGYERRVLYTVLASEGDEAPRVGTERSMLQRTVQAWSRNGRERERITSRLFGSGPAVRTCDWRQKADEQADNIEAWASLREKVAVKAKLEGTYPAVIVGRMHPLWMADMTDKESIQCGAAVWNGYEPITDEMKERLAAYLRPRKKAVPLGPDEDIL